MAVMFQPWLLLILIFHPWVIPIPICLCQPQNLEAFYPFDNIPSPAPSPYSPTESPQPQPPTTPPPQSAPQAQPPSQPQPTTKEDSSSDGEIAKAVAATAASTLAVSGLVFFLIYWFCLRRRRSKSNNHVPAGDNSSRVVPDQSNGFEGVNRNVRGLVVDENGLDVLYWRKLDGKSSKKSLRREVLNISRSKKEQVDGGSQKKEIEIIQEIPLLRGKSSTSHIPDTELNDSDLNQITIETRPPAVKGAGTEELSSQPSNMPLVSPLMPPPPPPLPQPPSQTSAAIQNKKSPAPPPPSPPMPPKKATAPPPPPPKARSLNSSSKPPPPPNAKPDTSIEGKPSGTEKGQVKMKPLHWDKLNKNTDHSMVWDQLPHGSFKFDGDLMEALFGYVATNRRSPHRSHESNTSTADISAPSAKTFILNPKRSQNIAIILKSLGVTLDEIIEGLIEGQALSAEIIEKLARIDPTEEEQSLILEYNGDPSRLADAESFLYAILKTVPSAFKRFNAMLFRLNYKPEALQLKESMQTLELGCKELRTRGLFIKLLEATLKAGNRLNAGTSRGNAQAFNLNALRKLSDVKSMDGKTTLLHFVVEEVIRSEGKRCVLSRNRSLNRTNSKRMDNKSSLESDNSTSGEDQEREYIMLGLPLVGGLSSEFSNVNKAALIDYDTFRNTCSALTARIAETKKMVSQFSNDKEGFGREMKHFLKNAEEEWVLLSEEQTRIMEIVRRTTEYYQSGASRSSTLNPLNLFVIVKDFLGMVDQACVDIAHKMQKRKKDVASAESSSSSSKEPKSRAVKFPILPENFFSDKSRSNSSDSNSH